jgi:hypothetical protein
MIMPITLMAAVGLAVYHGTGGGAFMRQALGPEGVRRNLPRNRAAKADHRAVGIQMVLDEEVGRSTHAAHVRMRREDQCALAARALRNFSSRRYRPLESS